MAEKNSNQVLESSQFKDCEDTVLEVRRKRCFENKPTVEEEPPTKKGTISTITQEGASLKNSISIPEQKLKVVKHKHCLMKKKSTILNCKWK